MQLVSTAQQHLHSTTSFTFNSNYKASTLDAPSTQDGEHTTSPTESPDLVAFLSNQSSSPGDLRHVLSTPSTKEKKIPQSDEITIDGKRYRSINVNERILYRVSRNHASSHDSLVDRGANGGLAGSDVRIICKHPSPRYVDVSGIDSHQITDLPIVTVGGVVQSQRGPVIAIMHQYAYMGSGKTIHSSGQLE